MKKARSTPEHDYKSLARTYLNGFPPTWDVCALDIPVHLKNSSKLYNDFGNFLSSDKRLFVVTGQSGGGKSTALIQTLLRYSNSKIALRVFELSPDVKNFPSAVNLIDRLHPEGAIIYINDIFIFGDTFVRDLDATKGKNVFVVSTARSNEWADRLSRYLTDASEVVNFDRFTEEDINPLIKRVLDFVPAPKFRKLSQADRIKRLKTSKSQLLIALKEATESDNFTNIITHEFNSLPDEDTKNLLMIVGLSTLARVGISEGMASEVYNRIAQKRSFEDAKSALSGIVEAGDSGRLFARHELYVRHIIENVVPFEEVSYAIISLFRYYTKYDIPIVRSVSRRDGLLFRFVLNHKFVADLERRKHAEGRGINIYEEFEVDFQLDGHFWLQYGLYLANKDRIKPSLTMLRRSIDAYPENPFAVHAYADIQLRYAASLPAYDKKTKDIIAEAVSSLKSMDASVSGEVDVYPIVTLANGHISEPVS